MQSITILSLILEDKWKFKKIYFFTILLHINYFLSVKKSNSKSMFILLKSVYESK